MKFQKLKVHINKKNQNKNMETEIQNPRVYNTKDAAKKIGVSYTTLFRMIKNDRIRAVNIARTGTKPIYAITAIDVEEYIKRYNSLQDTPSRDKNFNE